MNGGDLFKLQQIGGWKSHAMVQRYAHLAPHAFEGDWSLLSGGLYRTELGSLSAKLTDQ